MLSLVEGYIGRKFDYVLLNNGRIPQKAYKRYIKQGEHIFKDDIKKNGREIIRADLVAEYDDGSKVVGEHLIDEPEDDKKIVKFYFDNKAQAYQGAVDTIMSSDYIIIGPGDLYTTTLANIIVDGIPQALQKTKAKLIFISNLMSKKFQYQDSILQKI